MTMIHPSDENMHKDTIVNMNGKILHLYDFKRVP